MSSQDEIKEDVTEEDVREAGSSAVDAGVAEIDPANQVSHEEAPTEDAAAAANVVVPPTDGEETVIQDTPAEHPTEEATDADVAAEHSDMVETPQDVGGVPDETAAADIQPATEEVVPATDDDGLQKETDEQVIKSDEEAKPPTDIEAEEQAKDEQTEQAAEGITGPEQLTEDAEVKEAKDSEEKPADKELAAETSQQVAEVTDGAEDTKEIVPQVDGEEDSASELTPAQEDQAKQDGPVVVVEGKPSEHEAPAPVEGETVVPAPAPVEGETVGPAEGDAATVEGTVEAKVDDSGPPIVEQPAPMETEAAPAETEEAADGDGKEAKAIPKDKFYQLEEYQSGSSVSADSGIPHDLLRFFHSFGYDCCKRANLHLLAGPTLLFAAGNMVHIIDLTSGENKFLRSSGGGGIGAVTVHPSGKYFAVAEKGIKPHILVYEYPSLRLYRVLRGGTECAYSYIDFNPKGDLLASVGAAPDFMLTVWNWPEETIMLRSKAFSQEVYRVTFSPEQEGQLTSSGTSHVRFWKMAWTFTGLKLKGELGRFGKTSLTDIDGYIQLPDGKVLSGSDWGNMLLWDGGLIKVEICRKNQKPCHVGSVQQLVLDEGELITIGLDGYVRVWEMEAIDTADTTDDSDLFEIEPMNELKVGSDVQLTSMVKASLQEDPTLEEGASIWYAQDANGGIWKLDLSFSHTTKPPEKLYSFTAGAIHGLQTSPDSHILATAGDAYVRVYDYLSTKLLCDFKAPTAQSRGTALLWLRKEVSAKGRTIVAGFSDGIVRVLTFRQIVDGDNELILSQAMKPHSGAVTAIACDNTGEYMATGSDDKTVFFFAINGADQFTPIGFVQLLGAVTSIQWSPPGFTETSLLVACDNGKVVEISLPNVAAIDTSHSFLLSDITKRYYTFKSIKSQLRRDEQRQVKEAARAARRKLREAELKRRKDRGEEISDEDAQAFLDTDPEDEDVAEEEPLFIPPEPNSILQAVYLGPGQFFVSVDGYDAGYLYECKFSDTASGPDAGAQDPVKAVAVRDSNDEPITCIRFTADRRKMVLGFGNGQIRVYPLEADPDQQFELDMMFEHWNMNMHDNQTGKVTAVSESHDGAYLFSGGADGNMFGYHSLSHEEIVRQMEGKRAKLPTPKKSSPDDYLVDDIADPAAYSIEDAKLKAEHDKMVREAEKKKGTERRKIDELRKTFLELIRKNDDLPDSVRLKREEFELDPSLRMNMITETADRSERVRLEMQWDKAKLALAHDKLKQRFRSCIECDRITLHAFNSAHTVSSFRVAKLAPEFLNLREKVAERVRAASLYSDSGGTVQYNVDGSVVSGHGHGGPDADGLESDTFLGGAKKKQVRESLLHGRQAEKVAKALKKAEEAKRKREQREKEWEDLYKHKPDENYEDPADVAAIKEAQANMGDFKLKSAPDYVVPEHLRIDTEKKRYQMLVLQDLIHRAKSEFNEKLIAVRDDKQSLISQIVASDRQLQQLQAKMSKSHRVPLPPVPHLHPDETPHRKYEFTRDTLLAFEQEDKQREVDADKKKRAGDGGLFGGFGDDDEEQEAAPKAQAPKPAAPSGASTAPSTPAPQRPDDAQDSVAVSEPVVSELERQLREIDQIRLKYQRDRLLRELQDKMVAFDAELRLLRHAKCKLDVDLKMAELRQVTLLEELVLLKEYEKRENVLLGRVSAKRNELADINGKAAEMQVRLEAKRRDIDRLADREKALLASFVASLGDNNKFTDFLTKVFKKKIKRAKKKVLKEGEEEDSDEEESDESDWSSDDDEDDSVEGGFDDSVCPPGCDESIFDTTINLREKKLDIEEMLVEEKKIAEQLKKDHDALVKKAKVMEAQLRSAQGEHEAFQVEKQGKLNELDVVVPLHLHQVEHVSNASVPADLSQCLVFANGSLTSLQRRIKELQLEKSEQRKLYKDARQQHVRLIKNRRVMEDRTGQLEEKCEHMMMLKFGRIVDLEKLESVTVNRNVEELKERVRRQEGKNASERIKQERRIDALKDRITELTRDNTHRLQRLNVLINDKDSLERELDKRQRTLEFSQEGKEKAGEREQHRLLQLVQLQAQEIQALKEEIGLLSRKGGHILPPAQPPLGQETDVM